jgi:hypothetical protein
VTLPSLRRGVKTPHFAQCQHFNNDENSLIAGIVVDNRIDIKDWTNARILML